METRTSHYRAGLLRPTSFLILAAIVSGPVIPIWAWAAGPVLSHEARPQRLLGARVFGRGTYSLVDEKGNRIWTSRRLFTPSNGQTWDLTATRAVDIALHDEGLGRSGLAARATRLVLPFGRGVPVWEVHLPPIPGLLHNPVWWIHGRSGRVLHRENRIFFHGRVRVYRGNPVSTPEPEVVDLEGMPEISPGAVLEGPLVRAYNCPDRHELFHVTFMGMEADVHLCSEEHLARADDSGDFLFDPSDPNDPEDLFAEAHMFQHVMHVYDYFRGLGFTELDQVPLRAVVNFKVPDLTSALSPDGELMPFDNAFFLPAEDLRGLIERDEDSIVFGQGTTVDFAYDADVIYHEFTHAVVDTAAGIAMGSLDQWGVSLSGGTLHEGYADYFSSALQGDPRVGEYAGQGFGVDQIRDISAPRRCPDDLVGEVHEDSLPWSGALWEIRGALVDAGHDPVEVDRAVYEALAVLPEEAGFDDAAGATLAAYQAILGEDAARVAKNIFQEHGFLDCARVVEASSKDLLLLPGMAGWNLGNYAPGFMQLRVPVAGEDGLLTVEFVMDETLAVSVPGFSGGPVEPWVMIRAGEEPITFEYEDVGPGFEARPVAQRMVAVEDLDDGRPWPHHMRAVVPFGPGERVVHVMIFNRGQGETYMHDIRVSSAPDPDRPWTRPGEADSGVGEADSGAVEDAGIDDVGPQADSAGSDDGGAGGADGGGGVLEVAGGGGSDGCALVGRGHSPWWPLALVPMLARRGGVFR